MIYTSLFNENEKVRNQALSICPKIANLLLALDSTARLRLNDQAVEDLDKEPEGVLQRLKAVESELQKEKPDSAIKSYIRGWGWLCGFLGGKLVKSGKINDYCEP